MEFNFKPIGIIDSCFKEKFGIPKQPGLVMEARAILRFISPFNNAAAFKGLESYSHIWLIFVFHKELQKKFKAMVRPPRLLGNRKTGVFATRSFVRPNPIGISVVEVENISIKKGSAELYLKGIDLLDGTPVLDIKPYLPYADSKPNALSGFATYAYNLKPLEVEFSREALESCLIKEQAGFRGLKALIEELLKKDPRPAYRQKKTDKKIYGQKLGDFDLKFKIERNKVFVMALETLETKEK